MRILRPALLVLLTATLAGLGVPSSFGQSKATPKGKNIGGKNVATKSAQNKGAAHQKMTSTQRASAKKKAVTGNSATANRHATPSAVKGASARASGKTATTSVRKPSGKSSLTKRTRKQPGQKAPTNERVSEIQTALAKDGSFQGLPNGKWDDDTAAAMRRFQASHGLSATGKLDAPTLQRLGLGSETAGIAAPTPPPGATSRLASSNNIPSGDPAHRQ